MGALQSELDPDFQTLGRVGSQQLRLFRIHAIWTSRDDQPSELAALSPGQTLVIDGAKAPHGGIS